MWKATIAALALTLPIATSTALADPLKDTIEARQGFYKLLGANMGVFAGMAKGEIEYDAAAAQTAADNIAALTNYNMTHLYMPGTSADDYPDDSRALAKIWDDFEGVGEKGAAFVKAAMNMQAEAGKGKAEMGAALGQLGGSCKGCHDTYRAK